MFRRLLIATVVGILAAFAVAGFRHAMLLLELVVFLSNDSGSLVNAATNLSPWRRLLTPALGGLAAGLLLMGWQKFTQQRPHAPTDYMEALQTEGQFHYAASLVKSLASLLVVTSGSAIGREGAMIFFQLPLPPPVLPNVLRPDLTPGVEIMDRLWGRGGNGCGLSRPACWQFIYSRSAVWHYDVGLSRPGDYFRRRGVAG